MTESSNPYRDLLVSLETGFCVFELLFDAKGNVLDARVLESNAFFNRMLGREDMQGKTFLELFPGIDDSWFRIYQEAFEKKEGMRFEKHHPPSDHWYELYASPFGPAEAGRLAVVFTNITERKRTEAALGEREAHKDFLVRLEDAIRPLTDPSAIQLVTSRMLGEHLNANRVYHAEIDEEAGTATIGPHYFKEGLPDAAGVHPISRSSRSMDFIRNRRELRLEDLQRDAEPEKIAAFEALGARSLLAVPLLKEGLLVWGTGVLDGKPRGWTDAELALAREVAERTWAAVRRARTEKELRLSEQKYHSLFESIDEGFCLVEMIYDAHGKAVDMLFVETNPAFEQHTGLDLAGKRAREALPDYEDFWIDLYAHVARTGEVVRREHPVRDLGDRWFQVSAFRHGDASENRVGVTFTNITARKQAEFALRASEKRYHDLFESMDEGFCIIQLYFDEAGKPVDFEYLETNPAFERQAGMNMKGHRIKDLVPGFEQSWIDAYGKVALTGVGMTRENEVKGLGNKWFRTTAYPYGPPENRQVAVLFTNITDRKRSETVLEDFNKRLEQEVKDRTAELRREEEKRRKLEERQRLALLAATLNAQEEQRRRIAESLHNGIGQLLYGVQLNLGQIDPEPGKAWTAHEARRRRITSALLTQAIEDVRRVSHELMPGVLEDFGLRVALKEICRTVSGTLTARCTVGRLPEEIAPYLQVSIYRIAQELMANVIRHAEAKEVRFDLSHDEKAYRLEVSDDGWGFDPSRSANGIGLKSIREKVVLLKGSFEIDSGPEGTTVRIRIPDLEDVASD
jgi:PAS domain S-box-containing protein